MVPALVPSLRHAAARELASLSVRYRSPSSALKPVSLEVSWGLSVKSKTSPVPAAVPSVRHSEQSWSPPKYRLDPMTSACCPIMAQKVASATRTVPTDVPSLRNRPPV
jgi:hypothetical protein